MLVLGFAGGGETGVGYGPQLGNIVAEPEHALPRSDIASLPPAPVELHPSGRRYRCRRRSSAGRARPSHDHELIEQ